MKKNKKHIIDCDAPPKIPKGYKWTIEEHIQGGKLEWDPSKISLYLTEKQKYGYIQGHELRKEIQKPLNANVLDYLLENTYLIPEEWKGKYIYFWGTIYRNSGGYLCVRCLYWDDGAWRWGRRWLDGDWGGIGPAAVLASSSLSLEPNTSLTLESLALRVEKIEEFIKKAQEIFKN